jgi:hypothetical protein
MTVEPFQPYHIDLLRAQGVQSAQLGEVSIVPATSVIQPPGPALTVFDQDRVVLCGGVIMQAPGRGECWALMTEGAGKYMHWLHFAAKRFISIQRWRRLEASVPQGFGQGCRWVKLLGFSFEGELKNYGPQGETYLRFARYE